MFERLMRRLDLIIFGVAADRLAMWFLIAFTMFLIWQLFRELDSFTAMMGL